MKNTIKRITKKKAISLITSSNGKFLGLSFIKQDNTLRNLSGKYLKEVELDGKNINLRNQGYMTLFDVKKKNWRNVNIQTLKTLNVNKQKYQC